MAAKAVITGRIQWTLWNIRFFLFLPVTAAGIPQSHRKTKCTNEKMKCWNENLEEISNWCGTRTRLWSLGMSMLTNQVTIRHCCFIRVQQVWLFFIWFGMILLFVDNYVKFKKFKKYQEKKTVINFCQNVRRVRCRESFITDNPKMLLVRSMLTCNCYIVSSTDVKTDSESNLCNCHGFDTQTSSKIISIIINFS